MEVKNSEFSRRTLVRGAAVGAVALAGAGALAACSPTTADANSGTATNEAGNAAAGTTANVLDPKEAIDYKKATNFDVVPESTTKVGTTLENLKTAITGETGATTKYEAFSAAATKAGYEQISRLFKATADAEKIHIELEFAELQKLDPKATKPAAPDVKSYETDINLILGANGEIYETSDMYPSFVKVAIEEGNETAAAVFAKAKLAEAVHAERYLDAYNNIDKPDSDKYYLCPVCGYIHKGENFTACPICLAPKESFKAY
ncbi:MAG: rubrerythrin family protein [Actinomycetia bacterium]|nr:rubrerythrin family protein [Actinomycetes bacterium]